MHCTSTEYSSKLVCLAIILFFTAVRAYKFGCDVALGLRLSGPVDKVLKVRPISSPLQRTNGIVNNHQSLS